jgi:hypothetical protein
MLIGFSLLRAIVRFSDAPLFTRRITRALAVGRRILTNNPNRE